MKKDFGAKTWLYPMPVLTDGKIDVQKLAPITFDSANNAYVVLGQTVGKAFKDGLSIK